MISGSKLLSVSGYETVEEASLAIREFLHPA
jgi:hypothetical protein